MNPNPRRLRPIWRCGNESCKYYKTTDSARIQKPTKTKRCPRCNTVIYDYCEKHEVFHITNGFNRKCQKYQPKADEGEKVKRRLLGNQWQRDIKPFKVAKVTVTPKIKHGYNTRSKGPVRKSNTRSTSNKNYEQIGTSARSTPRITTDQTKVITAHYSGDIKCGMCLRAQVKDFCHKIPGCGNNDYLCMVCYPRWLTIWHQQSKDKKALPCPICCTGTISWDTALDPYRHDFIVMSTLQK